MNFLRINHYWARDMEFFFNVKIERVRQVGADWQNIVKMEKTFNSVYDPILIND